MRKSIRVTGAIMELAAVTAFATACTGGGEGNKTEGQTTSHAAPATSVPKASTPPAETVASYLRDPQRTEVLIAEAQRAGKVVLREARNPKSDWGAFIVRCVNTYSNGPQIPYKDRQPGDVCILATQDKAFGGTPHRESVQVYREVQPNNQLSTAISSVRIDGVGKCVRASIYIGSGTDPALSEYGITADGHLANVSDTTRSLAEAKRADAGVLKCLETLQP